MGGKGSGRKPNNYAKHLTLEGTYFETKIYPPECFNSPDATSCSPNWLTVLHSMCLPVAVSPVHDRDFYDIADFADRPQILLDLYDRMSQLSECEKIELIDSDGVCYYYVNNQENRDFIFSLYEGFLKSGLRFKVPEDRRLPLIHKKSHRHIIFRCASKRTVANFVKGFFTDDGTESVWDLLGIDPLRDVRKVINEMTMTRYLVHLDCKGVINKVQYDVNGIIGLNNYPVQKLLSGDGSDAELFDQIIKTCQIKEIRSERGLLEYIRLLGDKSQRDLWFSFVKKNLKLFNAYLTSIETDNNGLPVSVMSDNMSSGNTN